MHRAVVLSSVVLSPNACLLLIMQCICRSRAWHWAGWLRRCAVRRSLCTASIVTGRFSTITLRTRVGVRNVNASSSCRPVVCRLGASWRGYCFLGSCPFSLRNSSSSVGRLARVRPSSFDKLRTGAFGKLSTGSFVVRKVKRWHAHARGRKHGTRWTGGLQSSRHTPCAVTALVKTSRIRRAATARGACLLQKCRRCGSPTRWR